MERGQALKEDDVKGGGMVGKRIRMEKDRWK